MYQLKLNMPRIVVLLTFNVECKAKFRYFTVALMLFYTMKNILTCAIYFGNVYYQTVFNPLAPELFFF